MKDNAMQSNSSPVRENKNIILYVHGFCIDGSGYAMPELIDYVSTNVSGASQCKIIQARYNSWDYTFVEVAEQLMQKYGQELAQAAQCYAVCHSMGGVVARQMNVLGANFNAVVTLDTPHEGTARWVKQISEVGELFGARGAGSLEPGSDELEALNSQDGAYRASYHFVGVTYQGVSFNDNDTVVERPSQLGENIGDEIQRYVIQLDFGIVIVPQMIGKECPHNSLFTYPNGDNPLLTSTADTSLLLAALQNAIRL